MAQSVTPFQVLIKPEILWSTPQEFTMMCFHIDSPESVFSTVQNDSDIT